MKESEGGAGSILAFLGVVIAFIMLRNAWLCDDAYITLRTVDNFVNGYGLRWNIAERVQSYTHPLWMLLLTPFYAITREAYFTPLAVSVVCSMLACTLLLRHSVSLLSAVVVTVALCLSKGFMDFATSGLENPERLPKHLGFVWAQVDDAIGDHHVRAFRGHR